MRQTAKFDYYYGMQAEAYSFYRIPKVLFTSPYFKDLSCEAKVLYGLMLDRMALSIKNRWFDEEGRVYIIFSIVDYGCTIVELDESVLTEMQELASPVYDQIRSDLGDEMVDTFLAAAEAAK